MNKFIRVSKGSLVSLILLSLSGIALANCPDVSSVTYKCLSVGGEKHCGWSAPWYEGFPENEAKPGDNAASFQRVFWGYKGSKPNPSGIAGKNEGSTVCFYTSPYGNTIELSQNNFGGVPYPQENNWTDGSWQSVKGRVCATSPSACQFDYPNQN